MSRAPRPLAKRGRAKPKRIAPDALTVRPVRISRFRLMPITMVMAVLLLGVKVGDVYKNGRELSGMIQLQRAYAQGEVPDAQTNKKDDNAAADATPVEDTEANPEADAAQETAGSVKLAKLEDASDTTPKPQQQEFSQIELDILQSLSERREELEKRAQEMDLKEKLLEATELRINDKITEIRSLQTEVEKLLKLYNTEEESKVKGLVKIYENMKPKDAAQIFNELDMPILLEVIDQMSERKAAPIIAQMSPMKAKELTVDLAELRRLRNVPRTLGATQ